MASPKAIEAAKAVNSLLHLSSSDQESLLAVVEDYFTSPDEDLASEDFDSDTEQNTDEPGTFNTYYYVHGDEKGTDYRITLVHV